VSHGHTPSIIHARCAYASAASLGHNVDRRDLQCRVLAEFLLDAQPRAAHATTRRRNAAQETCLCASPLQALDLRVEQGLKGASPRLDLTPVRTSAGPIFPTRARESAATRVISWRSRSLLKTDRPRTIRRIVAFVTFRSSPIRAAPVPGDDTVKRPRRTENEENPRTAALNVRHPIAAPRPVRAAGVLPRIPGRPTGAR
jgi:hypothetical protein